MGVYGQRELTVKLHLIWFIFNSMASFRHWFFLVSTINVLFLHIPAVAYMKSVCYVYMADLMRVCPDILVACTLLASTCS